MSDDDRVSSEWLPPASGGWQCGSAQGLILLAAHERADVCQHKTKDGGTESASGGSAVAAGLSSAFQRETGYAASAIALTAAVDENLAIARFLATGGSSAAVLVMNAEALGRWRPPCDWETPLMRLRNRLADEGLKFFVALTSQGQESGIAAALRRVRLQFVARRVEHFCNREGIGFLGTVNEAQGLVAMPRIGPNAERLAVALAQRLASATFFCCDAFRTGIVPNLSKLRG
ncbi:MAG: hypothetical protein P4L40_05485 [Terracidiphilus sp.]|nr:hypothetical protein [Terracidiphilus sp.]